MVYRWHSDEVRQPDIQKVRGSFTTHHRRREGRPGFRRAAGNPCLFVLSDFGTGIMPFDLLHSSLREFLGP